MARADSVSEVERLRKEIHGMTRSMRREKGLYWDRAWSLVSGCSPISDGCSNCWAAEETKMRAHHPNPKIHERARGLTVCTGFSGEVRCNEDLLDLPLRVKKPTVWAVWTDLFHEDVEDEFRGLAYDVMLRCPQHVFLVLSKRAKLMAEFFAIENFFGCQISGGMSFEQFPQNVWHGVTAENQQAANERIPHLLRVPGKRFLSIEPMLGEVDLRSFVWTDMNNNIVSVTGTGQRLPQSIHSVLLGGESGKNARPMHPDWVRSVRDQSSAAVVPFFFKQWGEWVWHEYDKPKQAFLPNKVGKKKAGRTLDGRLHDDLPWGNP